MAGEREDEGGDTTDLVDEKSNEGAVWPAKPADTHTPPTRRPRHRAYHSVRANLPPRPCSLRAAAPQRSDHTTRPGGPWSPAWTPGTAHGDWATGPTAACCPLLPSLPGVQRKTRPTVWTESPSRNPADPPINYTPRKGAQTGDTGRRRPKRIASTPAAPLSPLPAPPGPPLTPLLFSFVAALVQSHKTV